MAVDTTRAPLAALRGSSGRTERFAGHGRGIRSRVLLDIGDALEPCIEGQALASEVAAHVERILLAAAAGSRQAVVNEAGRLGWRAGQYSREFRRMAADIEPPDGPEAA